jgi:cytoskeletal protein RodZ
VPSFFITISSLMALKHKKSSFHVTIQPMKRLQENGFELVAAIVIAAVVVVVGFTSFSIVQRRNNSQSNQQTAAPAANTPNSTDPLKTSGTSEATTVPSSQPATPSTQQSTSTAPSSTSPQKRTITFTKGGGSQNGDMVSVSANLSENQTGTCTYSFSLNGTERVRQTSSITNAKTCSKDIPVSDFPKSATYSFSLTFLSSDGLVSATQAPYDIEVH